MSHLNRNLDNQRRLLFREQLMEAIGNLRPIQQDDDSEEHKGLSKEEKEIYVKFMNKFLYNVLKLPIFKQKSLVIIISY